MQVKRHWTAEDSLGEVLYFLRMNGSFYCRSELTAPWGLALPPMAGCLWFHVVTSGGTWLDVEGAAPRWLHPGELVLVPRGDGHRLRSDRDATTPDILSLHREVISPRYEILRHGLGGDPTTLICGAVTFDHPAAGNLVSLLPRVLHVEALGPLQSEWIQSSLRLMAAEAHEVRPGGEAIITRLADILIVQAIRSWIANDPAARQGWIGALRDRQIGSALTQMHRDPVREWSVGTLAAAVAMSRSAFSARFTELVGEPPMRYLTRWRMQVAVTWLRDDDVTAGEVANRLGYQSEAAFSRAFKRSVGIPPGFVRRSRAQLRPIVGHRPGASAIVTP